MKLLVSIFLLCASVPYAYMAPAQCKPHSDIPADQVLEHLKSNYYIVRPGTEVGDNEDTSNASDGSNTRCPWKWETEIIDNTLPETHVLIVASCEDCSTYCRPVFYTHKVLQSKNGSACDETTGCRVWTIEKYMRPIAYVFEV